MNVREVEMTSSEELQESFQTVFRFGFPVLEGVSDEVYVGAIRAFLAEGDILSARDLLPRIGHKEMAESFWARVEEKTFWVRHREGWCTHVFEQGVCLAYYPPGSNGLYLERHTLALGLEQAHALLVVYGYERSEYAKDLLERIQGEETRKPCSFEDTGVSALRTAGDVVEFSSGLGGASSVG